ncbi:MAG: tRNA (adenosine(37)-N6)-dimethylallyltransferase MiaA, partial [Cryomorphaceae bacterium]|nr:tRNA (adenosine(37)-N6)-dimethylallyltransferase MiaA [Cryomorphaceae bacterium]
YLSALIHGFNDMPDVEENIRQAVNNDIRLHGLEWLQAEVKAIDPEYFNKVDVNNPRRLGRALEIFRSTGNRISDIQSSQSDPLPFPVKMFGIDWPRNALYQRIEQRVELMIAEGLEEEARAMLPYRTHQALQTVGYKEMFAYFDGTYTFEEAVKAIKTNTRRYAKRQLTWFRNKESLTWMPPHTAIDDYLKS